MFVLPVTPSETCDVTGSCKCNKSAGYDGISPHVIKSIIKNNALSLCDIFNKIIVNWMLSR